MKLTIWGIIMLVVVCLVFGIVMERIQHRAENRAYRKGMEDAKKRDIDNR